MIKLISRALRQHSAHFPLLLSLAGLGVLVAAGFSVSVTWGLVALGVSLFALEWRVSGE